MAIRLIDRYPNRANPANTDYPHGSGRNKSSPTAIDGTPFDENRFNDQEGFFQSLLEAAEVTPNNTPDTVPASQYADALSIVANGLIEIDVGGSTDAVLDYNQSRVHGFRLTGTLAGNIDVIVPDTERMYTVVNDTTGDFTVTIKTALGSGVVATQGQTFVVRCDGTDVVRGLDSQRAIYVGSVAELEALSLPVGANVYLTEAGKSGPGVIKSGTPPSDPQKGIYIVLANGNYWERQHSGEFNVEWFGAIRGSGNDSTVSIQEAINLAFSEGVHQVTVPAGSWYHDTIYLKRGVTLRGAGSGVTNVFQIRPPVVQGLIRADAANDASDVAVSGISLFGNGQVPTNPALLKGFMFEEIENFRCIDCEVHNFSSYGFWAHTNVGQETNKCRYGWFKDCKSFNTEHAYESKFAEDIWFINCHAHGDTQYSRSAFHPWERSSDIKYLGCTATGEFTQAAILILGTDNASKTTNVQFSGCQILLTEEGDGNTIDSQAINITRGDDIFISDTVIRAPSGIGLGNCGSIYFSNVKATVAIGALRANTNNVSLLSLTDVNIIAKRAAGLGTATTIDLTQCDNVLISGGSLSVTDGKAALDGVAASIQNVDYLSVTNWNVTTNARGVFPFNCDMYVSGMRIRMLTAAKNAWSPNACTGVMSDVIVRAHTLGDFNGSTLQVNNLDWIGTKGIALLGAASVHVSNSRMLADALGTDQDTYCISSENIACALKVNGGECSLINASVLTSGARKGTIVSPVVPDRLSVQGAKIGTDGRDFRLQVYTPNSQIVGCDIPETTVRLETGATNSILTNCVTATAPVDDSTGSVVANNTLAA